MEKVYMWQATDANGKIYKYENKPYLIDHCILWIENSGGNINYVKDSILDVPWKESLIEIKQDIVECVMPERPTTVDMLFAFLKDKDVEVMQNYIQMLVDKANDEAYDECIRQQRG